MAPRGLAPKFRGLVTHFRDLVDGKTGDDIDTNTKLVARLQQAGSIGNDWLLNMVIGITPGSEPCKLLLEDGTTFGPGSINDG